MCCAELKSFLAKALGPNQSGKPFEILTGSEFGVSTSADLAKLPESKWTQLSDSKLLGSQSVKRLREVLLKAAAAAAALAVDTKKDIKSDVGTASGGSGGGSGGGGDSKSAQPVAAPDRSKVQEWSVLDVGAFIRSLNPTFGEYAKTFETAGIDGSMVLNDIDSKWIEDNITIKLHRGRITRALSELGCKAFPAAAVAKTDSNAVGAGVGTVKVNMTGNARISGQIMGDHGRVISAGTYNQNAQSTNFGTAGALGHGAARLSFNGNINPMEVVAAVLERQQKEATEKKRTSETAVLDSQHSPSHKRSKLDAAALRGAAVDAKMYNEIHCPTTGELGFDRNSNTYIVLTSTDWDLKWLTGLNGVSNDIPRFSHHHHMFDDPELKSKWNYLVREELPRRELV